MLINVFSGGDEIMIGGTARAYGKTWKTDMGHR